MTHRFGRGQPQNFPECGRSYYIAIDTAITSGHDATMRTLSISPPWWMRISTSCYDMCGRALPWVRSMPLWAGDANGDGSIDTLGSGNDRDPSSLVGGTTPTTW